MPTIKRTNEENGTLPARQEQMEELKETARGRGLRLKKVTEFVYKIYGVANIGGLNAHQIFGVINFVKRVRKVK